MKKLKDGRLIIDMKDSSKDYIYLASVIQETPEGFAVLDGGESYLLPAFAGRSSRYCGCSG